MFLNGANENRVKQKCATLCHGELLCLASQYFFVICYWVIVVHIFGGKTALTHCWSLFRDGLKICLAPVDSSDYYRNHTVKNFFVFFARGESTLPILVEFVL